MLGARALEFRVLGCKGARILVARLGLRVLGVGFKV